MECAGSCRNTKRSRIQARQVLRSDCSITPGQTIPKARESIRERSVRERSGRANGPPRVALSRNPENSPFDTLRIVHWDEALQGLACRGEALTDIPDAKGLRRGLKVVRLRGSSGVCFHGREHAVQ
jgi:hypothetical protein